MARESRTPTESDETLTPTQNMKMVEAMLLGVRNRT